MDSTPLERMGFEDDFTPRQLLQAKRETALTFHPDRLVRCTKLKHLFIS
jgi:hypothetical protein